MVTNEIRFGMEITKFPGGGLEFGEGIVDCLVREIKEELSVEITDYDHFYTTGFFQPSAFSEDEQVISIYYLIDTENYEKLEKIVSEDRKPHQEGEQVFYWKKLSELNAEDFTFPIDQLVAKRLYEEYLEGIIEP